MAAWMGSLEQRASKLLETLDEKTSAKISENRHQPVGAAQSSDVSSLLNRGGLLSASSGALSALASPSDASQSLAPSTPARSSSATLTPTPATVMPGAFARPATKDEAGAQPAQRKEQMGLLANDLQVVLQHGRALHDRLQKEGQGRQGLVLRVRELERALDDVANVAAAREVQHTAELEALRAREAGARAQAGREHAERGQSAHADEVRAMGLRMEEQGRLAAQGLVEGERLKQALSAQAGAFAALRDECDSAQREQSALLAARGEREVHFAAREGALEARAAELADALALASRAAGGKAAEAARMAAELDGARLDLGRERVVREAAEAASTRAAAELSRLCDESGGRPDSAGAEGVQELARAELAQAEVRTAALQAKLDALRGQAAEAARARESAGGSAEQMLARAVAGTDGERGGRSNPATEAERARVQLDTLAKLLSEQQELVAQVNSDRSALKLELEAETKRRRSAEQLHSHSRKATAGEDIESGGGGERLTPAARMQLKRRWAHRPNVAKVMEVVDEAAQLIDRGSLQTTRFLSHNPYVRLMVACYVFILHLWVLVVLMHLAPGHYRHSNKLHAPAAGTMPPSVMLT